MTLPYWTTATSYDQRLISGLIFDVVDEAGYKSIVRTSEKDWSNLFPNSTPSKRNQGIWSRLEKPICQSPNCSNQGFFGLFHSDPLNQKLHGPGLNSEPYKQMLARLFSFVQTDQSRCCLGFLRTPNKDVPTLHLMRMISPDIFLWTLNRLNLYVVDFLWIRTGPGISQNCEPFLRILGPSSTTAGFADLACLAYTGNNILDTFFHITRNIDTACYI